VWEARTGKAVKRLGKGFFQRAVCAACFSYDTKFVCGISCDDRHSLGIWDVNTDRLVCEATSANGIPPQVRSLTWAPAAQMGAHISREHHGLGDVFVTTGEKTISQINVTNIIPHVLLRLLGERHLKFWSFQRPKDSNGEGALAFKGGTMGGMRKKTAPTASSAARVSD
jgi:WD40 repeat protein